MGVLDDPKRTGGGQKGRRTLHFAMSARMLPMGDTVLMARSTASLASSPPGSTL